MITKRQRVTLDFIRHFMEQRRYCPSYDEIAKAIGVKSKSQVHRVLNDLRDRGFIKMEKYKSRTIEILRDM